MSTVRNILERRILKREVVWEVWWLSVHVDEALLVTMEVGSSFEGTRGAQQEDGHHLPLVGMATLEWTALASVMNMEIYMLTSLGLN